MGLVRPDEGLLRASPGGARQRLEDPQLFPAVLHLLAHMTVKMEVCIKSDPEDLRILRKRDNFAADFDLGMHTRLA